MLGVTTAKPVSKEKEKKISPLMDTQQLYDDPYLAIKIRSIRLIIRVFQMIAGRRTSSRDSDLEDEKQQLAG